MPNDMSPIPSGQAFTLTNFLEGKTKAWGIFEDRFAQVKLRMSVEMNGAWSGDTFVLSEAFKYDDGREEQRQWHIKQIDDRNFTGTCADCIGKALGHIQNDRIDMRYRFRLKLKNRVIHVDFFDRLIRLDEKRVFNRATMFKWGVRLGDVSLFFEKSS